MGVEFIETESDGVTFVVGDMSPLGEMNGPGGTSGVAGSSLLCNNCVILDSSEAWNDGYGRSFFQVAMHEIGHAIGLGHAYELDAGAIMGGGITDFVFPGNHDIVHGQHLYRPDVRDVDFYRFDVPAGQSGRLEAETFAERLAAGSHLDTHLALYKRIDGEVRLVSANDDSFGTDSAIRFDIDEGEYYLAITAKGNEGLDADFAGSGGGGVSEGDYELRVKFTRDGNTIVDAAGTPIDGDADGLPGGAFDFWFHAHSETDTLYVDASANGGGNGSSATPFNEIDEALAVAQAGQTVRIVGNKGGDGRIGNSTNDFLNADDNQAYEIGRIASLGRDLEDGTNLTVPAGVNVMIDAGAVLKMQASRIAVGSNEGGIDSSQGSLQILGTPHLPVFFTSYNDTGVGLEQSDLGIPPSPGDWGGLDIRNAVDRAEGRIELEQQGIFINSVTGADIRYGGGVVNINGGLEAVAPIQIDAARPTLIGNSISQSASAAISADPASFEETTFNTPFYQRGESFSPDYSRVGPLMYGNRVTENDINGVLVRIDTIPGGEKESLLVSARFDDEELVHVLGDDLTINGNPNGTRAQSRATSPQLTILQPAATPAGETGLTAGTYEYAISFVNQFGTETLVSDPSRSVTVADGESVLLADIPNAPSEFTSRRLYRRLVGEPTFRLVAQLDRTSPDHVDSAAAATVAALTAGTSQLFTNPDARLTIDPGVILKFDGVRIELGFGGDLIAEGDLGMPVILTSRSDDRYGAGGTFDTNGDADNSTPAPENWAGIYAGPTSRLSLDHARISFAGGRSSIDGTSNAFNPVQILQAEARIAHTIFEQNASVIEGIDPFRAGRGPTTPAVIHVNGSEPILVNNTFIGTVTGVPAISINVNDLNATIVEDSGRQTGPVDLVSSEGGNRGAFVRGNTLEASGIAGLFIRGGVLTTEVVWDDTDIAHVVSGTITDENRHTYGGLRLQSRVDESLVVKFATGTAVVASGEPLDIIDRVGGTLHVIGHPDYPVILTTLSDDSVGAGFDPFGAPLTDTGGNGISTPAPGAWQGIRLQEFSNDRNVEMVIERENLIGLGGDLNGAPDTAFSIGQLAPDEKAGDETLRLGFTVNGSISTTGDQDVYSFRGTAGTEVWLDIDRTASSLDSVVELIDADGNVLAASDNSITELAAGTVLVPGGIALPMRRSLFADTNSNGTYKDLYTLNPLDAGMRLTLPGTEGTKREYFVRVRGNQASSGVYELQIRLRENDEFAGSTVRHSEIRFAQTGIETRGLPFHSPLTGEAGADTTSGVINLGNLGASDRGTISVSGNLGNPGSTNRYRFSVHREVGSIQQGELLGWVAATFDIDYADGLGRPNTSLLLYQINPDTPDVRTLIGFAQDSNIASDRATPLENGGVDLTDLTRGSAGTNDPFLGTIELDAGFEDPGDAQEPEKSLDLRGRGHQRRPYSRPTRSTVLYQFDRRSRRPRRTGRFGGADLRKSIRRVALERRRNAGDPFQQRQRDPLHAR